MASLQFPVGVIGRFLKKGKYSQTCQCQSSGLLIRRSGIPRRRAGNDARDNKKTMIVPRHIQHAVRNDDVLSKLLGDVTISNRGVMPNTHNHLLPKKTGASSKPSVDDD